MLRTLCRLSIKSLFALVGAGCIFVSLSRAQNSDPTIKSCMDLNLREIRKAGTNTLSACQKLLGGESRKCAETKRQIVKTLETSEDARVCRSVRQVAPGSEREKEACAAVVELEEQLRTLKCQELNDKVAQNHAELFKGVKPVETVEEKLPPMSERVEWVNTFGANHACAAKVGLKLSSEGRQVFDGAKAVLARDDKMYREFHHESHQQSLTRDQATEICKKYYRAGQY